MDSTTTPSWPRMRSALVFSILGCSHFRAMGRMSAMAATETTANRPICTGRDAPSQVAMSATKLPAQNQMETNPAVIPSMPANAMSSTSHRIW